MTPFDHFQHFTLTDILVPGYIERDERNSPPHRFRPMLDALFLQFDKGLLRFAAAEQFSQLEIAAADAIALPFEIDEDDVFAASSMSFYTSMPYHQGVRIESFRGLHEPANPPERFLFKVAELRTSSDDVLFFDPMNTYGVQLGNETHRDRWLRSYADLVPTLREVHWTRV